MIFPSNRVRIRVTTKPIDFRKGHDGLSALVKNELHKDPFTGTVFVFRSRKADRLKLIYWDGSGIVLAYKRLEEHSFPDHLMGDGHYDMTHRWITQSGPFTYNYRWLSQTGAYNDIRAFADRNFEHAYGVYPDIVELL